MSNSSIEKIDEKYILNQLSRRQKGHGRGRRMKIENDRAEIYSGVRLGKTIGAPIGLIIENINPLFTPRELELQLKNSGSKAIILLENFANSLESIIEKTSIEHVIITSMGELLGTKGYLINFVLRNIKKMTR